MHPNVVVIVPSLLGCLDTFNNIEKDFCFDWQSRAMDRKPQPTSTTDPDFRPWQISRDGHSCKIHFLLGGSHPLLNGRDLVLARVLGVACS